MLAGVNMPKAVEFYEKSLDDMQKDRGREGRRADSEQPGNRV